MSSNPVVKPSLAALALRLTLAAILIYSAVEKIAVRDSDWGASWATVLWRQRSELPHATNQALLKMLQAREDDEQATRELLHFRSELIAKQQAAVGPLPGALTYTVIQFAVAWGELLAGLALLLGLLTRLAALGVIAIQVGAVVTVTWAQGFSVAYGGGWGYNLALLGMCLALLCLGGGALSLSALLKKRPRPVQQQKEQPTPVPV
jgi:uncharacterized membrane protein YphA (DoxX/SURF4 family)